MDVLSGQKVTVGNRDFTVKGACKNAVGLIDENGKTRNVSFVGKGFAYGENGFILRDKGGNELAFVFADDLVEAVADPVAMPQNNAPQSNNEASPAYDSAEKVEQTLEETSAIQPEKAVEEYPYDQKKAIEGYAEGVDAKILDFVKRVRSLKNHSYRQKVSMEVAQNNKHLTDEVQRILGIDVSGFQNRLTGSSIEHIDKDHGIHGETDHSMANDEDIARIGFVLENFDSVEALKNKDGTPAVDSVYQNKDGSPSPIIRFSKK